MISKIVKEEIEKFLLEDKFTDDILIAINNCIKEVNDYIGQYGLKASFNKNYVFSGYSAKYLAVYQVRSVANGNIQIGINLPYIIKCMSTNNIPLKKLKTQLNISIWHEVGHGLVEFLKRLRRLDTQNGTGLFSKQMKKDFKYIVDNEEDEAENFGAMQEGYAYYSELDDFFTQYEENIINMLNLKPRNNKYIQ